MIFFVVLSPKKKKNKDHQQKDMFFYWMSTKAKSKTWECYENFLTWTTIDGNFSLRDFPGGLVAKTPHYQDRRPRFQVQSLIRELDPTCHD